MSPFPLPPSVRGYSTVICTFTACASVPLISAQRLAQRVRARERRRDRNSNSVHLRPATDWPFWRRCMCCFMRNCKRDKRKRNIYIYMRDVASGVVGQANGRENNYSFFVLARAPHDLALSFFICHRDAHRFTAPLYAYALCLGFCVLDRKKMINASTIQLCMPETQLVRRKSTLYTFCVRQNTQRTHPTFCQP